jgi:hypothetical protein
VNQRNPPLGAAKTHKQEKGHRFHPSVGLRSDQILRAGQLKKELLFLKTRKILFRGIGRYQLRDS